MGNPFDPFNLILFLIAVVGFIRLRMILGRRTGNEDPLRQNKYASRVSADIESLTKPKEKKSLKTKEDILSSKMWEQLSANIYVFLHQMRLSDITADQLNPCPAVPNFVTISDN